MPKFMSNHSLPAGAMNRGQVCQFAEAAQKDPQVKGYRSFINLSEGKAFCILEAKDKKAVAAWFDKMGLPYDSITQVELEGDRGVVQET